MASIGIRGAFFDFIDDPWKHIGNEQAAARFHADGLLVIDDGRIADFGPFNELSRRHGGLDIRHVRNRLILPGFIDGHIHFPQTRVIGAFGEQLLPWLKKWVFPEELKYQDRDYAAEGARRFFDNLVASGTTTCQAFTTTFAVSTEELFNEAGRRNMRLIAGLTGIDRLAPTDYVGSAEAFYRDTNPLRRIRMAFGSDVGAGNRFSMLNVLDEAYKVGMGNNATLKDAREAERNKISPYRGFWSITLGGAEGLYIDDLVGNFAPGKEADFVVLDWNAGPLAQSWRQSLTVGEGSPMTVEEAADLLFGLMMVGDDRAIAETWAMGRKLYEKG